MQNKLKEEIQGIVHGWDEDIASDKIYSLINDAVESFFEWKNEYVDYDEKDDDFYFMPNMVIKTEVELFKHFIQNIYKQ